MVTNNFHFHPESVVVAIDSSSWSLAFIQINEPQRQKTYLLDVCAEQRFRSACVSQLAYAQSDQNLYWARSG